MLVKWNQERETGEKDIQTLQAIFTATLHAYQSPMKYFKSEKKVFYGRSYFS
jgi:hypothetical protein|tara:strand:+ start:551 stop:706 length:156 start_codon:yes stop_codon:yes gene_type:complete